MRKPSRNSLEYTLTRLAQLDLLIRRQVLAQRLQQGPRTDDEFRGLYVSDQDVDALLSGDTNASRFLTSPSPPAETLVTLERGICALDDRLHSLEELAVRSGETPGLIRLKELFGLSDLEVQVVVICLAAEIDLKYERLYAYLQDDVTKKRPTVDLVMRLLCPSVEARVAARRAFEPHAPLQEWQLVTQYEDSNARRSVMLGRYLKLDERIAGFLLDSDEVDARLMPLENRETEQLYAPRRETRERVLVFGQAWPRASPGAAPVFMFHGRYGTGKRAAARILAESQGQSLLVLDAASLLGAEYSTLTQTLKLAEREAILSSAVLCWNETDAFLIYSREHEMSHRIFVRALAESRVPTALLAEKAWEPARELGDRPFLRLEMPDPTYAERRDLWADHLSSSSREWSEADLGSLVARFRLTAGQIRDAVSRARTLAWTRDPIHGHLELKDIDTACRSQAQHRLGSLARKLEPRYTWDDIVLPRAQRSTLRLICTTIRHRATVYGDWGFDRKLSLGKGLIALFAGPSGTGKTMAAEIIANDLGLDLFKIDLSAVVSKYIGETEKNLERIFGEAQDSDAILFFDEADALFGKRSEVKDAHDRYANIEIAYLLQRTEEYNGLVILASNIKKNMDEAFVRRLHFTVDFPFPEEAERLEIWQRTFPREAPRADGLDLPFLARKLRVTGGNIRNIILTAAFLAAEDKEPISMRQLVRAAGYEFQKMGKLVVEGDFEQYFDLARVA